MLTDERLREIEEREVNIALVSNLDHERNKDILSLTAALRGSRHKKQQLTQIIDMIRILACENNWSSIERIAAKALEDR